MFADAEKELTKSHTRYFGPALILELDLANRLVRIHMDGIKQGAEVWAKLAIPDANLCKAGETVLISGEAIDALYIIGILTTPASEEPSTERLILKDGANAKIAHGPNSETLEFRSKAGELIFEYDAQTGKSRVNLQSGDLEFVTQEGNIHFISAGNIRFSSRQSIVMKSVLGIRMITTDLLGKISTSINLNVKKLCLQGPVIDVTTQRAELDIADANYRGKKFMATIDSVKLTARKIQTLANDIVENAKTVYRTVEGLTQLKTGRMRTMVDSSYHLNAKKTILKAKEDFKVKAEKIHLG